MAQDILTGIDNEIEFANGDFLIGTSDDQHVQDILQAEPGHYTNAPLLGAGLYSRINSPFIPAIEEANIRTQLLADGFNVRRIEFSKDSFDSLAADIDATLPRID